VHYGSATRIDHPFDHASKKELFRLLYEIEEELPWSGLSIGKALDQHERTRRGGPNQPIQLTPKAFASRQATRHMIFFDDQNTPAHLTLAPTSRS
jgi:hypothetical protein